MVTFAVLIIFQSTYLREVRRNTAFAISDNAYFNPRTCERYDHNAGDVMDLILPISIHVPARGTTPCMRLRVRPQDFNPRTCERYDGFLLSPRRLSEISIHVPARGTTRTVYFWGGRRIFQSTYLREVRLSREWVRQPKMYFNPRTCERYD